MKCLQAIYCLYFWNSGRLLPQLATHAPLLLGKTYRAQHSLLDAPPGCLYPPYDYNLFEIFHPQCDKGCAKKALNTPYMEKVNVETSLSRRWSTEAVRDVTKAAERNCKRQNQHQQ